MTGVNQVCTCGFRRFRARRAVTTSEVERWIELTGQFGGGIGVTELGMSMGAGSGTKLWGLYTATHRAAALQTTCESCSRTRASTGLGGIAVFASYVADSGLYVVASGVTAPTTGFFVRFAGAGVTYDVELVLQVGVPPAVDLVPPGTTTTTPPTSGVVDALFRAELPEVDETATYTATFVDRCSEHEETLQNIDLEAEPMILHPFDADLGGAPESWLYGFRTAVDVAQPPSSSIPTIPFDYCLGVVGYDARFQTGPADQGFTHLGAGIADDYAMGPGGALRVGTTATLASYWQQTVVLAAAPTAIYAYANVLDPNGISGVGADGFDMDARYAADSGNYYGARVTVRDRLAYATTQDGADEIAMGVSRPPGWMTVGGSRTDAGDEAGWVDGVAVSFASPIFNQNTGPAAADHVLRSTFGDTAGSGFIAYLRNVVVSSPGRWIRAGFTAYARTATPVIQLSLISDQRPNGNSARFKIRYGSAAASPYELPGGDVDATVVMNTANTVYTAAFSLSGLDVNAVFWFTVERVAGHADDTLEGTVHFLSATIR